GYFFLEASRDSGNAAVRKAQSRVHETIAKAEARHMTFFEIEVGKLDDAVFEGLCAADAGGGKHRPMLAEGRKLAKHQLSEAVEEALMVRSPFGPGEWEDMLDEYEAALRFKVGGKVMTLAEALHVMNNDTDGKKRAAALAVVNTGFA